MNSTQNLNSITKLLIIKTSSMGDIIHYFPAIADLKTHLKNLNQIDWVVEENFIQIAQLQQDVHEVIPVAIRRWRKNLFNSKTYAEIKSFYQKVNHTQYDVVIDSQGLFKSAILTSIVNKKISFGYDKNSIKESIASLFYDKKLTVSIDLHAISRNRLITAKAFQYDNFLDLNQNIYKINDNNFINLNSLNLHENQRYSLFLHGTSRDEKLWDQSNWISLGQRLIQEHQHKIILLWSNPKEFERSLNIQKILGKNHCIIPDKMLNFFEISQIISKSFYIIGVDTGLSHLASALNKKIIGIYTITIPKLTSIDNALNLLNPSVDEVYRALTIS